METYFCLWKHITMFGKKSWITFCQKNLSCEKMLYNEKIQKHVLVKKGKIHFWKKYNLISNKKYGWYIFFFWGMNSLLWRSLVGSQPWCISSEPNRDIKFYFELDTGERNWYLCKWDFSSGLSCTHITF